MFEGPSSIIPWNIAGVQKFLEIPEISEGFLSGRVSQMGVPSEISPALSFMEKELFFNSLASLAPHFVKRGLVCGENWFSPLPVLIQLDERKFIQLYFLKFLFLNFFLLGYRVL